MNLIIWLVILSPLLVGLPIFLWRAHWEREAEFYNPGSDIGISANYWEA